MMIVGFFLIVSAVLAYMLTRYLDNKAKQMKIKKLLGR
ncbi:hypothetical protein JCM19236_6610 [Vibrio sp. JCM 19236]|nr:hypothetical protein JCM19236_6610 [Vibrio sp. JCM 19236]